LFKPSRKLQLLYPAAERNAAKLFVSLWGGFVAQQVLLLALCFGLRQSGARLFPGFSFSCLAKGTSCGGGFAAQPAIDLGLRAGCW